MNDYVSLTLEAAAALEARVDRALLEYKLSSAQFRLLKALRAAEANGDRRLKPSHLAALLLQATHSVSGLLNRLEDRDLITRDRDRTDRRLVWIGLTPTGRATLASAEGAYDGVVAALLAELYPGKGRGYGHIYTSKDPDLYSMREAAIAIAGAAVNRKHRADALEITASVKAAAS